MWRSCVVVAQQALPFAGICQHCRLLWQQSASAMGAPVHNSHVIQSLCTEIGCADRLFCTLLNYVVQVHKK